MARRFVAHCLSLVALGVCIPALQAQDHLLDELFRLAAKGEIDSLRGSEQISNYWKAASLHSLEQQGRPALFDYASMNFSQLKVWIDFNFNGVEIVFAAQEVEEGAKVSVHLQFLCALCG